METLAASHIHSSWSYDGSWTLEALAFKFRAQGHQVLLMTEHDRGFTEDRFQQFRRACAAASSDQMLVVPGIEYSDADNRVHVLVWGLSSFLGESLPTNQMLDQVAAANGVAVLAHPSRRNAWKSFEPHWADRLVGIEAWNRKYDGWAPGKDASALLGAVAESIPFVGLDFHTARQSFPLAMALTVNHANLTEESVVNCIRARECYPKVFGRALTDSVFCKSKPLLIAAEQSRRTARFLFRSAKSFSGKRQHSTQA